MITFLPTPLTGVQSFWGSEAERPVTIIGYDDKEGEWVLIGPDGEPTTTSWHLIKFTSLERVRA